MTPTRILLALGIAIFLTSAIHGKEPSWTGPVVKRGTDRVVTQSTPIENRPYRPFHFYGNTIRRMHYRGQVLPRPKDAIQGATAFVTQR